MHDIQFKVQCLTKLPVSDIVDASLLNGNKLQHLPIGLPHTDIKVAIVVFFGVFGIFEIF